MGIEGANCDSVISRVAARQHGVISYRQLRFLGLSQPVISRRAKAGRLYRIHRGVYAVGHPRLSFEGRCMGAALALGDDAVVSHRSAAVVWGMLRAHEAPIDLTLADDGGRKPRTGIRVHRSVTLIARLTTRRRGIPVTKPSRTLRDLRRTAPQPVFRQALRRALDLRLIRSSGIAEVDLTRSELERLFLRLCRRHRLPQPELNVQVGPYEVDFLWRDRGLIVEVDGYRHHGDRSSFERDRARDADLQSRAFRVLRFTYRQVTEDHSSVVAALHVMLGQRSLTPDL